LQKRFQIRHHQKKFNAKEMVWMSGIISRDLKFIFSRASNRKQLNHLYYRDIFHILRGCVVNES